jgi:hypothetical protein
LIRQSLPKGKSCDDLTEQDVQSIMDKLNNIDPENVCRENGGIDIFIQSNYVVITKGD